ncbi:MAG: hypothetical protein IT233_11515 [Bacteroidia bacterium]|nr:hypothetical protein [Bacteroidia bacterium]
MRTPAIGLLIGICLYCLALRANAQGCSDGGVCSVGSLSILGFDYQEIPSDKTTLNKLELEDAYVGIGPDGKPDSSMHVLTKIQTGTGYENGPSADTTKIVYRVVSRFPRYQLVFGVHYGSGERNTSILTFQLEGTVRLYKQKMFAQLKIPYSFVNGNLGSLQAPGDLTLSLSYYLIEKRKKNLVLTLGGKFPTNDANLLVNNRPLPMPYQTSLGSYDLLTGIKFAYKSWEITAGYQHAFTETNNMYLHQPFAKDAEVYNNFFESNQMKRADDAIFRISRSFRIKKATLNAGALGIYHLQEDTYIDTSGIRISATGSSGLTLNLNASAVFKLNKTSDLTFLVAGPVVNRKTRTDGLTRQFVVQLAWRKNIY